MIKVLVNGACGRMGQAVLQAVLADSDLELAAAVDRKQGVKVSELLGSADTDIVVENDLAAAIAAAKPEVMVDFTQPAVVYENAVTAVKAGVAAVIGTTGLTEENRESLAKLAVEYETPVFIAPNFAIGAVLLMQMAQQAAKYMPDVEIIELHHDRKLDAPSGTALRTAELIKKVRPSHQQGHPEEKEKLAGSRGGDVDGIKIHSVRLPGYVAHQEVIFGGLGQTLTIRHDSLNRESFMPGVVLACKKVKELTGLVVGLENIL